MEEIPRSAVRSWMGLPGGVRFPAAVSCVCPHCSSLVTFSGWNPADDIHRRASAASAACPNCNGLVRFWAMRANPEPKNDSENPLHIFMYPPATGRLQKKTYPNIPEPLQRALSSTVDAFNNANYIATAVSARRTLEGIFKYRVEEKKRKLPLAKLIDEVKNSADLAAPLSNLSHAIRDGGNLGAHFEEKEPTRDMAMQMVQLLDYLVNFLYVLPREIQALEASLGKEPEVDGGLRDGS